MEANKHLLTDIEKGFAAAIQTLKNDFPDTAITDLFIQADMPKNKLVFFDDEDHRLYSMNIPGNSNDEEKKLKELEKALRAAAKRMENKKAFEGLNLLSPFSIILVNEEFEPISEVYVMDNDQIVIGNDLMGDWEKDLDEFMEKIIRDF